ncbi:M14 family metallocarboxypeptidase [Coraliomargarita sp. SDUM461004]|uniref:M14 family metallocarboxypeptidase n=1 Tax=Thalassobacterium sedimentorum TaxID=3041258 RepID=A0ABU1AKT8_9BACT|nr:M14 family metallocarboxypeptidase [Coraliomargarita sp. SDUM461004]MDQ8195422.1 M14 family metallocarboxypeptidase [Coraliomargarita sp. SDUM461004]
MMTPTVAPLIQQLQTAGEAAGFQVTRFGQVGLKAQWPLLGMTRPALAPGPRSQHIYLSAGIHGDEPATSQAILELLQNDALPPTHHYYICPLLNPAGLANGTRENPDGIDLNRDYRDFVSQETRQHAAWIQAHIPQLDCALHLHEDWESQGFYLYEIQLPLHSSHPQAGKPQCSLAQRILAATEKHLPTETATEIDGFPAQDGIIRIEVELQLEAGQPEALCLQASFGGSNYTLETPSAMEFRKRVDTLKAAVLAAIQTQPQET